VVSGWTHDSDTGSIVFDERPAGDVVEVSYATAEGCP
jgi:hypothetical protein